MMTLLLAACLSSVVLAATPGDRVRQVVEDPAFFVALRVDLVSDPAVTEADLAALSLDPSWPVRDEARAVLTWRRYPVEAALAWSQSPERTRAGFLRFPGGPLLDPAVASVLLERFVHGGETLETRQALLDAVVRSEADWDEAVASLIRTEGEEALRADLAFALRKAISPIAVEGIRAAMRDPAASVRAEACRSAGRNRLGRELTSDLLTSLADPAAEPRAMAARSLGWLRVEEAWAPLMGLLPDPDPEVRLQAIRALDRLDRKRLSLTPELGLLLEDPNDGVRRAAEHILRP